MLSQDGYGSTTSLSLGAIDFPVPALAVGRLVETPNEIAGLIDQVTISLSLGTRTSTVVLSSDVQLRNAPT